MYTADALQYFGTKTKLARAAGVRIQSIYKWGLLVPEVRARRLQSVTNGDLKYDPIVYDEYTAMKHPDLNDETQSAG